MIALLLAAQVGAIVIGRADGVEVRGRRTDAAEVRGEDVAALAVDVAWASAPPVRARAVLVADGRWRVVARAGTDPLVLVGPGGVVIGAELDDPSNAPLRRWGYLGYVLDAARARAAGRAPPRFAEWPGAPVPGRGLAAAWALATGAWAILLSAGFVWARRRARREPDAHLRLFRALQAPARPTHAAWTRPGIARPLGGFFLFLSVTLLAMGPYLYVTALLLPSRVQPFPDVDGQWAPVDEVAWLAWALADLGMTLAFVKGFAEHRVRDPARALRCAQLYVWWQLAGGLVLFAALGALACAVLPASRYALLSRVLLLRAAMMVPGVLSLFTVFFQAAQRFDYQVGLDLLEKRLLFVALPVPFILAFRAAYADEAFGALAGIAAGQYAALVVTFAVGLVLYRRLGLPVAPLVHAGFDARTFREMARYGLGVVAGKAPFFLANAVEIVILTSLLPGYPAWLGVRHLIMSRLVFTLWFLWPFIDSGVPAFSEALAARKHALARYYVVRYLQLGHLFVALVIAFLVAAGPPLIVHALPVAWHPAATFLPLAAAAGLFLPAAWTSDALMKGAGRTGLDAAILTGEQALRIALFYVLVPRLGFAGIFVAILVTLAAKVACGWRLSHRLILRVEPHVATSVIAPLLTGVAVWALVAGAWRLLPGGAVSAVALFVTAALALFPLGFFLCGLIGGLDDAAVRETADAAELASFMRPVARLLARAARLGARLSPLRRPAPPLAEAAAREADELVALERS